MRYFWIFVVVTFVLLPLALRANDSSQPVTMVNVHSLGPERVGNLPPVLVPADNPQTPAKILLGKQLYYDTRLSKDNTVSCASCHNPAMGCADAGPTSTGINNQRGGRRAPPVSNAAHSPLQFWDGRAANLEEQAKGPIQNPVEMGNTHELMIRTLNDVPGYVEEFKAVFGNSPITVDQVAQAIAAYERTIVTSDSPFDRFIKGDQTALTPLEKKGLEVFNGKGHCSACHFGGNFSDGRFHNIGVKQYNTSKPDNGRYVIAKNEKDMGAFKTPTVRDASLRAPYLHDGSESNIASLVAFYNRGGDNGKNIDAMIVPLNLSRSEVKALIAFMNHAMVSTNPSVADEKPIPPDELPK